MSRRLPAVVMVLVLAGATQAADVYRWTDAQGRVHYADRVERDGLVMTFSSVHRPQEAVFAALEAAGLVTERLVEVADDTAPPGDRWQRIPLFLHLRVVKPA